MEENEESKRIRKRMEKHYEEIVNMPLSQLPSDIQMDCFIQLLCIRQAEAQKNLLRHFHQLSTQDREIHLYETPLFQQRFHPPQSVSDDYVKLVTAGYLRRREEVRANCKLTKENHRRQKLMKMIIAKKSVMDERKNERNGIIKNIVKMTKDDINSRLRRRRQEEERMTKERFRLLMENDEAAYRRLIKEQKNQRLTEIMRQTDGYIESLCEKLEVRRKKLKRKDHRPDKKKFSLNNSLTDEEMEEESNEKMVEEISKLRSTINGSTYADDDDDETMDENGRNRDYYQIAHSISEKIVEQPKSLSGGKLKPYQLTGLEWLVSLFNNNLNGILADEMGLGKTIQSIAFISYLHDMKGVDGPFLVVVPLSTISNWVLEFSHWNPILDVVSYTGRPIQRKLLVQRILKKTPNVLLTTYDYIQRDRYALTQLKWKYLIVDEGHRMKNHDCKLTRILNQYYTIEHRLLLTGTPLQNRLPELWALLNFLLPDIFGSVETFEQWFSVPFAGLDQKIELEREETILVIRRLHKVLRPFILRRLKKEVELQLPDKVEYVVKCGMSAAQKHMTKQMLQSCCLLRRSDNEKNGNVTISRVQNQIMQLRKICNHPFIFEHIEELFYVNRYEEVKQSEINSNKEDEEEEEEEDGNGKKETVFTDRQLKQQNIVKVSGKLVLLDKILPKLLMTNHKVLLFSQMTACLDVLQEYCDYRQYKYVRLDGSIKVETRAELLKKFNEKNSQYFIFLLSTRAGGLGLNLQAADTVIIFDSDWNPQQDLQAQDRAHRIGQTNEVRVLRLITANSIEERILATAKYKLGMDDKIIQAGLFDQKSTPAERRAMLASFIPTDVNEEEKEQDELTDNEQLNELISRNGSEFQLFQKYDKNHQHLKMISDEELPEWMKMDYTEKVSNSESDNSLKKRNRTPVTYSDPFTDFTFMKACENGTFHEEKELHASLQERMKSVKNRVREICADFLTKLQEIRIPSISPSSGTSSSTIPSSTITISSSSSVATTTISTTANNIFCPTSPPLSSTSSVNDDRKINDNESNSRMLVPSPPSTSSSPSLEGFDQQLIMSSTMVESKKKETENQEQENNDNSINGTKLRKRRKQKNFDMNKVPEKMGRIDDSKSNSTVDSSALKPNEEESELTKLNDENSSKVHQEQSEKVEESTTKCDEVKTIQLCDSFWKFTKGTSIPINLNKIQSKVYGNQYMTTDEFLNDINRMCASIKQSTSSDLQFLYLTELLENSSKKIYEELRDVDLNKKCEEIYLEVQRSDPDNQTSSSGRRLKRKRYSIDVQSNSCAKRNCKVTATAAQ
ncbi:hypothetical protein SNEBB_000949 [Seison nebaliae]|nr:hypothetical protein SNEBB_000949 [Seison nebaliae]